MSLPVIIIPYGILSVGVIPIAFFIISTVISIKEAKFSCRGLLYFTSGMSHHVFSVEVSIYELFL